MARIQKVLLAHARTLTGSSSLLEALEKLIESDQIPEDKYYVLSKTPSIGAVSAAQDPQAGPKPEGLWFSVGDEWLDFLVIDYPAAAEGRKYLIELNISGSCLSLSSKDEVLEFSKKYGVTGSSGTNINWKEVSDSYSGIVIAPYQNSLRTAKETRWYYGWDVASGCVWSSSAITGQRLAFEFSEDSGLFEPKNSP